MSAPPLGILLMAYGTPDTLDDVAAYYTHIRGGRRPSDAAIEDLTERYRLVGGRTPLLETTRTLAGRLQQRLDDVQSGRHRVYVGMKHWHPYIADVLPLMAADGIREALAITLAPHYSKMSIGTYKSAVEQGVANLPAPIELRFVERWHDEPRFRAEIAARITAALTRFGTSAPEPVTVVFSAHSLPERILAWGDPYPRELHESAAAIAELAGVVDWRFAYQSAGKSPEPWLGPDILDVLDTLADEGKRRVISVPFGFVADHLEIFYDIDHEAQAKARERGMELQRTASLNADPAFVEILAAVIDRQAPVASP